MNETLPESATRKHHKFGPSRMEYLDNCAAFENRIADNTDASDEGTMLHDLMAEMLTNVSWYEDCPNTLDQLTGWVYDEHELTDEQKIYLRFCCKRCDTLIARNPVKILVETNIVVKNDDGSEFNHGYLDVAFIFANDVAILVDFKFGYIPVPHANINLQGMNYTVGLFQMFPNLKHVGVKFMQPKLLDMTEFVYHRENLYEHYSRLRRVVDQAKLVQDHPGRAQDYMRPGPYCEYCALAGSCAMLANHRATFASQFGNLPVPVPIANLQLHKIEDWALARYWVDIIDKGIEGFKERAMEVAEQNGGELRCTLPNGEEVVYEVRERGADRVLGGAREVAEALQQYITFEELLGAAKLSLTKLEPIVKEGMIQSVNASLKPGEKKLTKKAAWEQACSILEVTGLLSKPDTRIRFLQLKKQQKQLVENNETQQDTSTQ